MVRAGNVNGLDQAYVCMYIVVKREGQPLPKPNIGPVVGRRFGISNSSVGMGSWNNCNNTATLLFRKYYIPSTCRQRKTTAQRKPNSRQVDAECHHSRARMHVSEVRT